MTPGRALRHDPQSGPAGPAPTRDELARRDVRLPRVASSTTTTTRRSSPASSRVKLAEGFVDGIFHGRNDLVVDTDSMSAIGLPTGGFVRDTFALGTNDVVYHVNYFSQLSVIGAISQWLPLGLGASDAEAHLPEWMTAGPVLDATAARRAWTGDGRGGGAATAAARDGHPSATAQPRQTAPPRRGRATARDGDGSRPTRRRATTAERPRGPPPRPSSPPRCPRR